ncbi:MAG: SCO family protein [Bacteroidia bacterium]|nr:SCO family protein [Bacteroidia bacterium]MDW8088525.1 SCO family protein [Bacteroidia bacterium]
MKAARLLWGGIGGAGLLAGGWWVYHTYIPPAPRSAQSLLPLLARYPLTDAQGYPADISALTGKVVLLNFIYTRCPSVCPRLQAQLRAVLQALPPSPCLVAVSISLDPERDTGSVWLAYQHSYAVPGHPWLFWRPSSQKWAFALAKTVFGLNATILSPGEILHADAILLLDSRGRLRGVYSSTDTRLLPHVRQLLRICDTVS